MQEDEKCAERRKPRRKLIDNQKRRRNKTRQ